MKAVHHLTPGRSDLNFGKAINDMIEFLPDDDWICLRDIDTLPLHHRVFFKQCEDIANSGEWDLVSCKTNRIGVVHQLHENKLSDNFDIKHHLQIARERFDHYGSTVKESCGLVAGVMMLFSKQTWEDVGRFKEGGVQVDGSFLDYIFSKKVQELGGKIGVANGIYLFHIYREWEEQSTRMAFSHLLK